MSNQDIDKAYVSPYDKFLFQYEKDHAPSLSQEKEIKKNKNIAVRRDNPFPPKDAVIWDTF